VTTLREKVFASLDAATDNGYDMTGDPSLIAVDMLTCDASFDNLSDDDAIALQEHIIDWQEEKKSGKDSTK
jgi:hypothetical protein